MGVFSIKMQIGNSISSTYLEKELLVDTGADYSMLPASWLRNVLGIVESGDTEKFELADGTIKEYEIGEARFRYSNRDRTSPIVFGPEDMYILGAVTLQSLGLIADTTRHTLIPAPKLHLVGFRPV